MAKAPKNRYRMAVDYLIDNGIIENDSALADKFKMSKGTLSTYLKGTAQPSKPFLKKFEELFPGVLASTRDEEGSRHYNRDPKDEEIIELYKRMVQLEQEKAAATTNAFNTNLDEMKNNQLMLAALTKTAMNLMARVVAKGEHLKPEVVQNKLSKETLALFELMKARGIELGEDK